MPLDGAGLSFCRAGESKEQVMAHVRVDHGMESIPPEVAAKVEAAMHEE